MIAVVVAARQARRAASQAAMTQTVAVSAPARAVAVYSAEETKRTMAVRIAHLCQSYAPMVSGTALFVQKLAEAQARRGLDTLVLAASADGPSWRGRHNGCSLVRLRSYRNPLRASQRFALWPAPAIQAALQEFRPDCLHLHDPLNLGLAALQGARRLGIPIVLTAHQLPSLVSEFVPAWTRLSKPVERALWAYAAWLLQHSQAVTAPSHATARVLRRQGRAQVVVIGNGVDTETFRPGPLAPDDDRALRRRYGLDPQASIILHVGRLDADRHVDRAVRAAVPALRVGRAQLVVVGDGTRRAALEGLCRTAGVAASVRFLGFIQHGQDLPRLYRLAEIYLSACEIESFGMAVLEAMASGLPIVAVRGGATPELVTDGRNGILTPPGDVAGLASGLEYLLADPERSQAMGRASRAAAEQRSFERTEAAFERLYLRLRANARGREG
jgi:glycosyltransferase involved in cell wall biosynthesis